MFAAGFLLSLPFTAFFLTVFATFEHHCSYVGDQGVAQIAFRGSRSRPLKKNVVLFKEVYDAVAKYKQGRNARTLEIEWRRADFSRILKLQTTHSTIDFTRRSRQLARLIPAAEAQWSSFLMLQIAGRLALKLPIEFRLKRDGVISVSPGRVFITGTLQKSQLSIEDRKSINLQRGFFSVASKEAGFLTNRGRMMFSYSDLGNASVFLSVVESYLS